MFRSCSIGLCDLINVKQGEFVHDRAFIVSIEAILHSNEVVIYLRYRLYDYIRSVLAKRNNAFHQICIQTCY